MSCFNGCVSPDNYETCCNAQNLCQFDGDMSKVVSEPIYVQKIYDAVMLNLQGLKTVTEQKFFPAVPAGFRIVGVSGIKCKKCFNPGNINDSSNLKLTCHTTISGASFVSDSAGEIKVIGADGTMSEKLLYADTTLCDENEKGTPIFGTQNVSICGNVIVTIYLILVDNFGREVTFPVSASVNISATATPMLLTSFFEMCMPSVFDTAFLPRFTEICNIACETRLATNSYGRDISVSANGEISANLIIALCINCEKKIIVPVQLCVLSTGFVEVSANNAQVCSTFPQLFPNQINDSDDSETDADTDNNCYSTLGNSCNNQYINNYYRPSSCCDPCHVPPNCAEPFPIVD